MIIKFKNSRKKTVKNQIKFKKNYLIKLVLNNPLIKFNYRRIKGDLKLKKKIIKKCQEIKLSYRM